jgi:hypothetical protein
LGKFHLTPQSSTNPNAGRALNGPKLVWPTRSAASHGDTRCNGRLGHPRRCLPEVAPCWRFPSPLRIDTRGLRYSQALTSAQTPTLNHHIRLMECGPRCCNAQAHS